VTGIAESAKGAAEIGRAMDGARKHAVQNARSSVEQARAMKDVEAAARDVSRLASSVTEQSNEQASAIGSLVRDADEVRRISRQTARAVGEQASTLSSLSGGITRQIDSFKTVAQINLEHAQGTEQIAKSVREVRTSMREISTVLSSHVKSATTSAETTALIAREIGSLRALNAEQVQTLSTITETFDGNGSTEPLA
jgi:methyl-accepting chemotaxis protein